MPNRGVLGMAFARRYRPHCHFARVCPYPNLERCTAVFLKRGALSAQVFLHAERRVERELRMVLVRDRRSE